MKRILPILILLGIAAGAMGVNPYMMVLARKNAGAGDYLTDLAHRWTFDADLTDSIGSADMTAVDGASASGGYLVMDGTDDGAYCTNAVMANKSSVTFTAWVRPVSENQDHMIWGHSNIAGGESALWIDDAATDTLTFLITDNGSSTTGSQLGDAAITRDGSTWTHVAWTFDGTPGVIKTYVNGSLDNAYTNAAVNDVEEQPAGHFYIGAPGNSEASKEFNGAMDDIRIYDAVLSLEHVTAIYNATTH